MNRAFRTSLLITGLVSLSGLAGCAQLSWPWQDKAEQPREEVSPASRQQPVSSPSPGQSAAPRIAVGAAARVQLLESLQQDAELTPESVGYFMDVHEAHLRRAVAESPVTLRRSGNVFLLTIPGEASFGSGSSSLKPDIGTGLTAVAEVLAEFDKTLVAVHGHTDTRGDDDFNLALSERRALAVAKRLLENGVGSHRLASIGHGETMPHADEDTEEARAKNRRIEITVEPVVKRRAVSSPPSED